MPTIAQIRELYPMYHDVPDGELVRGLHRNYYKDMPYADFLKSIDFRPAPNDPIFDRLTPQQKEMQKDAMARPWGGGLPKLAYDLGGKVTDFAAEKGASPETAGALGYGTNVL